MRSGHKIPAGSTESDAIRDDLLKEAAITSGKIRVTKLDAARRQLRTAISLWFTEGDPVAIHTLVYAAHEIIHRLFRLRGHRDLMFDSAVVKDEYRGEFARYLKEDANFFKHAKTDATAERTFNPLANDLFLLVSLVGLHRMGEPLGDEEGAYWLWLSIHHSKWFHQDLIKNAFPDDRLDQLRQIKRRDFFEAYLLLRREATEARRA